MLRLVFGTLLLAVFGPLALVTCFNAGILVTQGLIDGFTVFVGVLCVVYIGLATPGWLIAAPAFEPIARRMSRYQ